jgi:multiple sugar transport system permease protein
MMALGTVGRGLRRARTAASSVPPRRRRAYLFAYGFLAPIVALFAFLRIIPIAYTAVLAFFNWSLVSPDHTFVGLDNFSNLLGDPNFQTAFLNTTIIAIGTTVISIGLAFFVAAVVAYGSGKMGGLIEVLFFLPVVTPLVPATLGWRSILDYQHGLLNAVFGVFGIPNQAWTTDPTLAIVSIIVISVWAQVGYNMIILLVGMRSIPRLYYEAAAVDGASTWRQFRHITVPLMVPILLFVTVITTIQAYNVFTQVFVLASDVQGAPGYLVRVLVYDIFQNGFRYFNFGYAAAEAIYLFLVVIVLMLIQFRLFNRPTD